MFEPQKVNNYYSLTLVMKIVTRESSPSDRKLNDTTQMKQGNVYILQTDTGRYFKVVAK